MCSRRPSDSRQRWHDGGGSPVQVDAGDDSACRATVRRDCRGGDSGRRSVGRRASHAHRLAGVPRASRSHLEPPAPSLGRERVHRQRHARCHGIRGRRHARLDNQPHRRRARRVSVPHWPRRAENRGRAAKRKCAPRALERGSERRRGDGQRNGALAELRERHTVSDRDRTRRARRRGRCRRPRLVGGRGATAPKSRPQGSVRA